MQYPVVASVASELLLLLLTTILVVPGSNRFGIDLQPTRCRSRLLLRCVNKGSPSGDLYLVEDNGNK